VHDHVMNEGARPYDRARRQDREPLGIRFSLSIYRREAI
jgi:hypothetical protein